MLELPALFTAHAVLQHSRNVAVWGRSKPGACVAVSFRGTVANAVAGADGRFEARLASGVPGGPFELVFASERETRVIPDVLVGEVWLCSGQSNMSFQLSRSIGAADAVAAASYDRLRLLGVPRVSAPAPSSGIEGAWKVCSPETASEFSAVAFHFGKRLQSELGVPIGLICAAVGSTGAEAWIRREDLLRHPALAYLVDPPTPHVDPGIAPEAAGWKDDSSDVADWGIMECPTAWEHAGLILDGAVWFRKDVEVPSEWADGPLELSLGIVDDFDHTYFNGHLVGAIGPETPDAWKTPRRYRIPAEAVRAGRNTIAVRVFDQWGCGGLRGAREDLFICPAECVGGSIPLYGEWRWKVELALSPRSPADVPSCSLYNGMIHPLLPTALAGVIWYQGETNVVRADEYRMLFPALIRGWREAWRETLPFLFVLLAGWHRPSAVPAESGLAELRQAQLEALALERTAAVSAVDLGDVEDIHPPRKEEVGVRLAWAALATTYGRKIESSGPTLRSVEVDGASARLVFDHAAGLHCRGSKPLGFAVAGADGTYVWADVVVAEDSIRLSCSAVPQIRSARYNWSDNPVGNLYNEAGLPMLPFRTDAFYQRKDDAK